MTVELRISGLAEPRAISSHDLAALPGSVADVSEVAAGAVGRAVPLREIVRLAAPHKGAAFCTVVSRDGAYCASIPIDELRRGGWLAFAVGDEPLPVANGGPLRLTVAAGTTLCWNVKDVGELRFTAEKEPDSVPENPPH
jgi:DMSO/TMAO reductase YedYZ molybdopterin-dependent catalytic subunit